MATRTENVKALLSNTRARLIVLLTATLVVIGIVIGVLHIQRVISPPAEGSSSSVLNVPGGIQSIPGATNTTLQYMKLQSEQNIQQAKQALKTGSSAIPTIIQSQAFGQGVEAVGPQGGTGGIGFAALAREEEAGGMSPWFDALKQAHCAKVSVQAALNQGAGLSALRQACSCAALKSFYTLSELQSACSCKALKQAGFTAIALKDVGYDASRLKQCGFNACNLKAAGFTAQQLRDAGFSADELKGAGYDPEDIKQSEGLPAGVTPADVRQAGCNVQSLIHLREEGVSASAIRRMNGCTASQLKAAGYTAQQLKDAGFSAAELAKAGFSPDQLKAAGFLARDLLNAGFTPQQLAEAGYSPAQIREGEAELPPGVTSQDVKSAGCSEAAIERERLAGVSAASIRQYAGCSAAQLKAAGFTDADLSNAGFTPAQIAAANVPSDAAIRAAGCDPAKLHQLLKDGVSASRIHALNGCNAAQLKAAGFTAEDLANAGFTPQQLLAAGFTPDEVKAAEAASDAAIRAAGCDPAKLHQLLKDGVSASRIHALNGCSAAQLKAAGFTAEDLANAGFTPQQLLAAGFTPDEVKAAEAASDAAIRAAGCDPAKLHQLLEQGVSAARIHALNGCSAAQLKAAGFTAEDLANAGFTPQQLLAAGFTPAELSRTGLGSAAAIASGRSENCSAASLRAAFLSGVSAATIKQTLGCSAAAMKAAGYTAAELKAAGYTAAELKNAGFTAAQLKAAGFSAKELADAGFTAAQLKDAGFSAADLRSAGFSAQALKDAGFSASQLKDAGFSASALRKAGFSAQALKDAGYSNDEIGKAGFSNDELKAAGILPTAIAGLAQPSAPVAGMSTLPSAPGAAEPGSNAALRSSEQLQSIVNRQNAAMAAQRYEQNIQNRAAAMLSAANQSVQAWKMVSTQAYEKGHALSKKAESEQTDESSVERIMGHASGMDGSSGHSKEIAIKTGDILFAVLDNAVNSDEPSPILATIVSGKLKGSKLIGSFTLPANADKMVIMFNTISIPGAPHTDSISAYAIDANTARTALSSRVNHHYLSRYGSLFASSFLEGFGNAFQSANTTVTIGGTGGGNNFTVQNGIGRSALENAVIGLATVGKSWGQVAQQNINRPVTVEVYSGTGIGVLFTQDVTISG